MRLLPLVLALTLSGCSSFKLGAIVYLPFGMNGTVSVSVPEPASTPGGLAPLPMDDDLNPTSNRRPNG